MEVWRICPSVPGYIASSEGRVMRVPYQVGAVNGGFRNYGGKPWFGTKDDLGRMKIVYRGKNLKVHQMVCEAFHGMRPFPNAVVMHINDDPTDNRPENLKWATQKENLNTPKFLEYCRGRVGENSPAVKGRLKKRAA